MPDVVETDPWSALHSALHERGRRQARAAFEFAAMLGHGVTPAAASTSLGLSTGEAYQVAVLLLDMARSIDELEGGSNARA